MEGTCRLVRGLIRLARGELPGALADAASAVELAGQMGDPEALLAALAFHARALLANGHLDGPAPKLTSSWPSWLSVAWWRPTLTGQASWPLSSSRWVAALSWLRWPSRWRCRLPGCRPLPPSPVATSTAPRTSTPRSGRCPTRPTSTCAPPSSSSARPPGRGQGAAPAGPGFLPAGRRHRLPAPGQGPMGRLGLLTGRSSSPCYTGCRSERDVVASPSAASTSARSGLAFSATSTVRASANRCRASGRLRASRNRLRQGGPGLVPAGASSGSSRRPRRHSAAPPPPGLRRPRRGRHER